MSDIEVGMQGENTHTVSELDTAAALGSGDVPVLATPRLIAWLEAAAVAATTPNLAPGSTTVGTRVVVDHLAATPVGGVVRAVARVTGIEGSRLTFEFEADESGVEVARGTHTRAIVDRNRFVALVRRDTRRESSASSDSRTGSVGAEEAL